MKVEAAEFVRSAHRREDLLQDGRPEVAFVGRSNVGKSSLLNRLLGRKGLAKTSSTPGRTRAVNYFLVNGRLYFVDLPGYGYAKAGKQDRQEWADLVETYFRQALPAVRVVMLVDGKVGATPLDRQAFGYLTGLGAAVTVTATKIDQVPRGRRAAGQHGIRQALGLDEEQKIISVSARTGEGIRELWTALTPRS